MLTLMWPLWTRESRKWLLLCHKHALFCCCPHLPVRPHGQDMNWTAGHLQFYLKSNIIVCDCDCAWHHLPLAPVWLVLQCYIKALLTFLFVTVSILNLRLIKNNLAPLFFSAHFLFFCFFCTDRLKHFLSSRFPQKLVGAPCPSLGLSFYLLSNALGW